MKNFASSKPPDLFNDLALSTYTCASNTFYTLPLSPIFFAAVTHVLSLYFTSIDTVKIKYCVLFTYPALTTLILPTTMIMTTPSMRSGLKCGADSTIDQSIDVSRNDGKTIEPLNAANDKGEVGNRDTEKGETPDNSMALADESREEDNYPHIYKLLQSCQ